MSLTNANWRIVRVPAGKWSPACKAPQPNERDHNLLDPRTHLIPRSKEACIFTFYDMNGDNTDHITKTGLRASWVKVGDVWVEAYRIGVYDRDDAYIKAMETSFNLDAQISANTGCNKPVIKRIDLG